jgi:hypothetical protein
MARKHAVVLMLAAVLMVVVVLNFSLAGANDSVVCSSAEKGVVEKAQGDSFTVTVVFQNTGRAEGSWSVNVVFEGDAWSWVGTSKNLTLAGDSQKTLVWNGAVPANATINSIARLVVYYGDSFKALDWWIRVVPAAELTIKSSNVS